MGLGNAQWQFLTLSSTEPALAQQRGCQGPFTSSRSCTSALPVLGADLAADAVLFKARAALPVEGQPTSPRLGQPTNTFSFTPSHLQPGRRSSVSWPAPCVHVEELLRVLVVNVCELLAGRSSRIPPSPCHRPAPLRVVAADARQSPPPELEAGGSPTCMVGGQLGFSADKPVPLMAVPRTLLLNRNHNPLCRQRCYPHRKR